MRMKKKKKMKTKMKKIMYLEEKEDINMKKLFIKMNKK